MARGLFRVPLGPRGSGERGSAFQGDCWGCVLEGNRGKLQVRPTCQGRGINGPRRGATAMRAGGGGCLPRGRHHFLLPLLLFPRFPVAVAPSPLHGIRRRGPRRLGCGRSSPGLAGLGARRPRRVALPHPGHSVFVFRVGPAGASWGPGVAAARARRPTRRPWCRRRGSRASRPPARVPGRDASCGFSSLVRRMIPVFSESPGTSDLP